MIELVGNKWDNILQEEYHQEYFKNIVKFINKLTSLKKKKEVEDKLLATTSFKEMEMHYQVDEDLIGGMVIRIGDRVVDSSVKNKLFELQRKLLKTQL